MRVQRSPCTSAMKGFAMPSRHSIPSQENGSSESRLCGFDDLVPGNSADGVYGSGDHAPHETEYVVQRALLSLPDVHFSSLEVHRMPDGICLTGIVKVPEHSSRPHFGKVAGAAAGISRVLDRLVVQRDLESPDKSSKETLTKLPPKG